MSKNNKNMQFNLGIKDHLAQVGLFNLEAQKKKQIYIYPSGKVGRDIAHILEFCGFMKDKIYFLDDNSEMNLNKLAPQIAKAQKPFLDSIESSFNFAQTLSLSLSQGREYQINNKINSEINSEINEPQAIILLASRRYFLKLAQNCKEHNLFYKDGCEFAANALDAYLASLNMFPNNTIGVSICGPSGSKHRGSIEKILKDRGLNVIFCCSDEKQKADAADRIGNSPALILQEEDILRRVKFPGVFIVESSERLPASVSTIYTSHTVATPQQTFCYLPRSLILYNPTFVNSDYIISSCERGYKSWRKILEYLYVDSHSHLDGTIAYSPFFKVLPLGASSLDRYVDEIESTYKRLKNLKNGDSKTLLVCFNTDFMPKSSEIIELLENLLNLGYEIIYRPHPMQRKQENHAQTIAHFSGRKGFVNDVSTKLDLAILQKSPIMINDVSSMGYSFAIGSLTPTLTLLPSDPAARERVLESGYLDPTLHKVALNIQEVPRAIEEIADGRLKYADKIREYIKNEVFNFGNASEKIADFICELLAVK